MGNLLNFIVNSTGELFISTIIFKNSKSFLFLNLKKNSILFLLHGINIFSYLSSMLRLFFSFLFLPNPPPAPFFSLLCQRPSSNVWQLWVCTFRGEVSKSCSEALWAGGKLAGLFPGGTHHVSVFKSFLLGWSDFPDKDLLVSCLEDINLAGSIPFAL